MNATFRSTPTSLPRRCGPCTGKCVYNAVNMTFVFGVVANAVVIARVARDRKLHKPTFMAIAGLAAADMLYLVGKLTLMAVSVAATVQCNHDRRAYEKYTDGVMAIFWFSATFHVTLLAVLRFLILTRPLRTRRLLTNRRVLLASGALWALAVVCIGPLMLTINLTDDDDDDDVTTTVHIVTWFLTYFLPVVVTSILHLVKISVVRRSLLGALNLRETRRTPLGRMTRTITMVIVAGAVLPLPKFVATVIVSDLFHVQCPTPYRVHVDSLTTMAFLLNFCVNPFIYSFSSPAFMESIYAMLGFRRSTAIKRQSTRTASSPIRTALETPLTTLVATPPQTPPQSTSNAIRRLSHCEHI